MAQQRREISRGEFLVLWTVLCWLAVYLLLKLAWVLWFG
jgi:hypothetical protein